jgi:rsbT co-antagonist protein RsbR
LAPHEGALEEAQDRLLAEGTASPYSSVARSVCGGAMPSVEMKMLAGEQPALEAHWLSLSEHDVARRRMFVDLREDDLVRISAIRDLVQRRADEYVATFFDYLAGFDEATALFGNPSVLGEARQLKRDHLVAMVEGDYGTSYAHQRLRLGILYGKVDLDVRVFLGAYHHLMKTIGVEIMANFDGTPEDAFQSFMALKKIGFFDIAIIVDVLIAQRERTITIQQEAIRELSTPVLQLRDGLLILPIIGLIDSRRAKQLTDDLLRAIRSSRARVVVLDITGVAAVDSRTANHLIQTVEAARLVGGKVIVTGLSPTVAQTLAVLGVDLGALSTVGDLQGGLEIAERLLGYELVRRRESPIELERA